MEGSSIFVELHFVQNTVCGGVVQDSGTGEVARQVIRVADDMVTAIKRSGDPGLMQLLMQLLMMYLKPTYTTEYTPQKFLITCC